MSFSGTSLRNSSYIIAICVLLSDAKMRVICGAALILELAGQLLERLRAGLGGQAGHGHGRERGSGDHHPGQQAADQQ